MWRRLGPREVHFVLTLLLIIVLGVVQSMALARSGSPWLRMDLVTILVVYISVEHFLLPALLELLFAAIVLHAFSATPALFFVMYHVGVLVIANLVSRRVALWSLPSQLGLFAVMLVFKHFLLLGLLWRIQVSIDFVRYFSEAFPGLVASCLLAIPLFRILARIDQRFQSARPHELPMTGG